MWCLIPEMLAVRIFSADRQREVLTTVGSLAFHVVLLGSLALRAQLAPEEPLLSPLRFSGQTFDIDALGAPSEDEADANAGASEPAAGADTPPDAPEPQAEDEPSTESQSEPDSSPPMPEDAPEPETSPPKAPPAKPSPAPKPTGAPKPPPRVDPFDLGVPGEPSTGASAPPRPRAGAYGQEEAESSVVDLYPAFLKTLPLAAKADSEWLGLPEGAKDYIDVRLTVDESGKLLPVEVLETPEHRPPDYLKRAVTLNRSFLIHGRFALAPSQPTGTQTLRLVATILKREPDRDTPDAPGVRAFGLQGDPAIGVYFTYYSGHHVQIKMRRLD